LKLSKRDNPPLEFVAGPLLSEMGQLVGNHIVAYAGANILNYDSNKQPIMVIVVKDGQE